MFYLGAYIMRQRLGLVIIGAIALAMAGCASETPPPVATTSPAPAPAASPAAAQQPFAKPLVAQKPVTTAAVPGLIQPTNADERVKRVQANINKSRTQKDPFASVPVPVQSAGTQNTSGSGSSSTFSGVPPLPGAPQPNVLPGTLTAANPFTSGRRPTATPPRPSSPFPPRVGTNPNATGRPGRGTPTAPAAPAPPPPPVLADATEVSGIAYVGGQAQAIVKAPNEPTSRYVRVGQRLSDGQVLVKRIELNVGADPVVVLEQNGVEVSKVVGEKAAPPPGSPTA